MNMEFYCFKVYLCVYAETLLKVVVASGGERSLYFELDSVHYYGNYPLMVTRDDPQPYSKASCG